MTEEFNLIKERGKWIHKWLRKKITGRCIAELRQTDKEFIEGLKDEIGRENEFAMMKIDKLEGDENEKETKKS